MRGITNLLPGGYRSGHLVEVLTVGAASAAMYRWQQTGDAIVILEAAGAIVLLTVAAAIARGADRWLNRLFGLDVAPFVRTEDEPDDCDPRSRAGSC
jgi:hypothetical protein